MKSHARNAAALGLVMAASAWIHAGSLSAPFFADDYLFLDQVRGRSLPAALLAPDPIGNYFRPVSRAFWFWLVGGASGESAGAFHLANLALWLVILWLTYRVTRRLLPAPAALAGTAVLAVHHAADVPVMWTSGSQDLLAVLWALAAIDLHAAGRRGWASVALAFALLSKETVALAPLVAVAVARPPGTPWNTALRRAWPLFATLGAWAAAWLATARFRPTLGMELHAELSGALAALVHLVQTAVGIEWPLEGLAKALHSPPPLALLVAAAGVAIVAVRGTTARDPGPRDVSPGHPRGPALIAGTIWALAGALPIAAVAPIWSAYYYLFSLCGVALVAGALVGSRPWWVVLLPVLLVGFLSENARRMPEFATQRGAWTAQSHLNRHFLTRGGAVSQRCLADLRRARPEMPRGSTLYFIGLPAAIGFQTADGPVVRWAYRDTSLRSYFLSEFRLEHAARGSLFFFQMRNDTLVELTGRDSLEQLGFALILSGAPSARDMLKLAWQGNPSAHTAYRLAWTEAAQGELSSASRWLEEAGVEPATGPTPEIETALQRLAAGDTLAAIQVMEEGVRRHALDPGAHALMADLLLTTGRLEAGAIEAYAVGALARDEPSSWRRWGLVLAAYDRVQGAVTALERYQALAGEAARADAEVESLLRELRRNLPGGDIAQQQLERLER